MANFLFSLNGNDFGASYEKLKAGYAFSSAAVGSMAYFCKETGSGRFTPLVAGYAAEFIKKCIDNPQLMSPKPSWEPSTKRWQKFSALHGYGQIWKFTGAVQENIGVIYRGRHDQTVGIKRGIKVPKIGYKGTHGSIGVAEVAAFKEWGTRNKTANPLFTPAIRTFVVNHWPGMVNAADTAIKNATSKYASKYRSGMNKNSGGSAESVVAKSISADFKDVAKSAFSSNAKTLATSGSTPVWSSTDAKKCEAELVAQMKRKGMSAEDIANILANS